MTAFIFSSNGFGVLEQEMIWENTFNVSVSFVSGSVRCSSALCLFHIRTTMSPTYSAYSLSSRTITHNTTYIYDVDEVSKAIDATVTFVVNTVILEGSVGDT